MGERAIAVRLPGPPPHYSAEDQAALRRDIERAIRDLNASLNETLIEAGGGDHGSLAGLADDDHTQYHTDARALTWLGTRSTTDLPEGSGLYYTNARADARIALATLADLASADASELDAGVLADARVQESNITQHQAALSITESQISDLDHYADADADARIALATLADLASASASDIDSGTLADARLSSNVPLLDAANSFVAGVEQAFLNNTTSFGNGGAGTSARLDLEGGAGGIRGFLMKSGTASTGNRWLFYCDTTAESGSNAGSDFLINRYGDSGGAPLGTPLSIERATGLVSLAEGLSIGGGQTIADSDNVPLLDAVNEFLEDLTVFDVGANTGLNIDSSPSNSPRINFRKDVSGSKEFRWDVRVTADDNDGDNDGADMLWRAFDDDGSELGVLLTLNRRPGNARQVSLVGKVAIADSDGSYSTQRVGFFGTTPQNKQTGVAVTAAGIHAALVNYGLIT